MAEEKSGSRSRRLPGTPRLREPLGRPADARLKMMETLDQNGEQRILFLVKNISRLYALGSLESGTSSHGRNYFYALR